MSQERELLTTQQAASLLNISDRRLRQLIEEGKAQPAMQIGGTWMFSREEIERLRTRPTRRRKTK